MKKEVLSKREPRKDIIDFKIPKYFLVLIFFCIFSNWTMKLVRLMREEQLLDLSFIFNKKFLIDFDFTKEWRNKEEYSRILALSETKSMSVDKFWKFIFFILQKNKKKNENTEIGKEDVDIDHFYHLLAIDFLFIHLWFAQWSTKKGRGEKWSKKIENSDIDTNSGKIWEIRSTFFHVCEI